MSWTLRMLNISYRLQWNSNLQNLIALGRELKLLQEMVYPDESRCGIKIGSKEKDVRKKYGPPLRQLESQTGSLMRYTKYYRDLEYTYDGIVFNLYNGKVRDWVVYQRFPVN